MNIESKHELQARYDALLETHHDVERDRDRSRTLFERSPIAQVVLDRDDRVVDWNARAAMLADAEHLAGLPWPRVTTAFERGRTVRFDRTQIGDRTLVAIVALAPESAPEKSSRPLEVIGSSALAVAHELNNLLQKLGSVFGRIELATDDEQLKPLIAHGHATVQFGADMIRRMLRFGQVRPSKQRAVVIDTMLASTTELMRPILGPRVSVTLDGRAPGLQVYADPGELELAILNLATNARDAMPTGGSLAIATRVVMSAGRRWISLTVEDSGGGIPLELQARVFDVFVTTKSSKTGSGLGLPTTKSIVEAIGGSIALSSEPGKGTTFRILLPVYVAPPLRLAIGTRPMPQIDPRELELPKRAAQR